VQNGAKKFSAISKNSEDRKCFHIFNKGYCKNRIFGSGEYTYNLD
jgi:hypothetical protein